jgi:type II secretory pathway pseudopilin PulG
MQKETGVEDGFGLVALVVAIFLILLVMGVAAPKVAHELRRDREVEAMHRGNQYVRAVQLYYKKFGRYPGTLEQLEKTSNIRFLRQKYVDPMTGKSDWRIIHVGEAKTTVKGFFGKPLQGLAPGLGSAAGMASAGSIGAGATGPSSGSSTSAFGGTSTSAFGGSSAGSAFGSTSTPGSTNSTPGATGPAGSTGTGNNSSPGISSQPATDFKGGGAPFVGVGSGAGGNSILELNEQTTYNTWEFIYDPRIEQLKAKATLFGGGASTNATGLGSASGNVSPGLGGSSTPPTSPGTGMGTTIPQ